MPQNVWITGAGRKEALGYHLVLRCLERGDRVIASVRRKSEALEALCREYPCQLRIFQADIGNTASVRQAVAQAAEWIDCLDLLVNNAVTTAPHTEQDFWNTDLDAVAPAMDVTALGPLRMIQAAMPLLEKSRQALIVNISSEAGSIGACYRTNMVDYGMGKAALNMGTKLVYNSLKEVPNVNIFCLHPGWMRTNEGNAQAPLIPRDHALTLLQLFEEKRRDKEGSLFITYEGTPYPW